MINDEGSTEFAVEVEDYEGKVEVSERNHWEQLLISAISGISAGIICTIICSPLDVAKIRLQVQGSLGIRKYSGGSINTIRTIYSEEGIRGVFRGIGPAMFTVPLFWGTYWPIYDRLKAHFTDFYPDMNVHSAHMLCAISAGGISDVITNPFWVARTRIQTLALHTKLPLNGSIPTLRMMRNIYAEEGIMAFYRGLGASFLGLAHVAIQFPLYEHLKKFCRGFREDGKETFVDLICSSIASKLLASSITYPHEVLRARLQDGRVSKNDPNAPKINIVTVTRDVIQKEGVKALWSGLRVNLVRIIPATCTTFVSYEYISKYLHSKYI